MDLYLSVPVQTQQQRTAVVRAAGLAAERMIKQLDETIAYVDRELR